MHHDASTTTPAKPKYTSSPERKRRRIARGLPPMTERAERRAKEKYDAKRAFIDAVKIERGCADCGYSAHPAALHFDHLPGVVKVRGIAQMANHTSMARLVGEIAKCEVVCANCHAIRTAKRRAQGAPCSSLVGLIVHGRTWRHLL